MQTISLKTLGSGIAALALMFVLGTSARASLVIEQVSSPVITGSWTVGFQASGVTLDEITGTILSGADTFEAPGLVATGWTGGGAGATATISGAATTFLPFSATFTGLPSDTPYVTLEFQTFDAGVLTGESFLAWNGQEFDVVPEPTTMIAGALLLLPFAASTLWIARRQSRAA